MLSNEADHQRRGSVGVACSVLALPSGKLRIVMDDVTNANGLGKGPWKHRALFTWKDFHQADLERLEDMSEAELAEFGFNLLTRLVIAHGART